MKKSILCLLLILTLCLSMIFVSCKKDDEIVPAPDAGNVDKQGVTETDPDATADVKNPNPDSEYTADGDYTPAY